MSRYRRQPTPIADAFLPEMRAESRYLSNAIQADAEALKNEAARFQFAEAKKNSLRKDYEWNNKVALDEMTDQYVGGYLERLSSVEADDPEGSDKLSAIMGGVDPKLYNNVAVQQAFSMASDRVVKASRVRDESLDQFQSFAKASLKDDLSNPATTDSTYQLIQAVSGARTLEEKQAIFMQGKENNAKMINTVDALRVNRTYFNNNAKGRQFRSLLGIDEGEDAAVIMNAVIEDMGYSREQVSRMSAMDRRSLSEGVDGHMENISSDMDIVAKGDMKSLDGAKRSAASAIKDKQRGLKSRLDRGRSGFINGKVSNGVEEKEAKAAWDRLKADEKKYNRALISIEKTNNIDNVRSFWLDAFGLGSQDASGGFFNNPSKEDI